MPLPYLLNFNLSLKIFLDKLPNRWLIVLIAQ